MGEDAPAAPLEFRGVAEEAFEALAGCFSVNRMLTAGLGLGVSLVLAAAFGAGASTLLLGNALGLATLLAIAGGVAGYIGMLLTYGALCAIAVHERVGQTLSPGAAGGFALRRSHILVGIPMCTLVIALGAGSLGAWIAQSLAGHATLGAFLGPIALIVLFLLNLFLVAGLLLTHALAAPCAVCVNVPFWSVGSRLLQIAQERFPHFLANQAAVLVAGVPLLLLTALVLSAAFMPALSAVANGRARAAETEAIRAQPGPAPMGPNEVWGGQTTARPGEAERRSGILGEIAGRRGILAQAPLVGVVAVVALLLFGPLLIYAANAESAVYIGLTGDHCAAIPVQPARARTVEPTAEPRKHPPIVHCWRCDAINRYSAVSCSKCRAVLSVCPRCFATNEPGSIECHSCGRRLLAEEKGGPDGAEVGVVTEEAEAETVDA